jgi:branched-chain amino acid transport system permease protein
MATPQDSPLRNWTAPVIVFIAALAVPYLVTSGFQLRVASIICIYTILCIGFNLLYGFAGQISMGQQGFFALGAYAYALLTAKAGWPLAFALPASVAISALAALVIGIPLLRLRTHYLAMATLCFGLVFSGIASRWIEFTGGTAGMPVAGATFMGDTITRVQLYYVIVVVTALVMLLQTFIVRSHLGRALSSIKGDETAAASLGVNVTAYKLRIFVVAAVLAAVAGVAFALLSRQVNPSFGEFPILVSILTISVVGGLGTRFGPLLGSIVVVLAPQFLASFGELETLIYGVCLLVFLLFLPQGLAGSLQKLGSKIGRSSRPTESTGGVDVKKSVTVK